jgi:hypothetical protein
MRPAVVALADEAHEELGPLSAPDGETTDWALLALLQGLLSQLQPMDDLVRDTNAGTGYSLALDVDNCPDYLLRWLGQFAGVKVTPGDSTDAAWVERARAEIRNAAGWRRGTPAAIRGAAQEHLTGTKTVRMLERTISAYTLTVLVRTSETPDPAAAEAAVRAQKPAGLILTFIVSDAPIVDEGSLTIDNLVGAIDDATVADWT